MPQLSRNGAIATAKSLSLFTRFILFFYVDSTKIREISKPPFQHRLPTVTLGPRVRAAAHSARYIAPRPGLLQCELREFVTSPRL